MTLRHPQAHSCSQSDEDEDRDDASPPPPLTPTTHTPPNFALTSTSPPPLSIPSSAPHKHTSISNDFTLTTTTEHESPKATSSLHQKRTDMGITLPSLGLSSSLSLSIPLSIPISLFTFIAHITPCGASPTSNDDAASNATALSYTWGKRDENNGSVTPKVYIPIIVAFIILFILGVLSWFKTGFKEGITGLAGTIHRGANPTTTTSPSASARNRNNRGAGGDARRELTAAQLTGDTGAAAATGGATTGGGAGGRRGRRGRRPRRTPSQMSVTSLPEYHKEPGDAELVIFRGRDPEDVDVDVELPIRQSETPDSSRDGYHDHDMTGVDMDRSTNNLLQPGYADRSGDGDGDASRASLGLDGEEGYEGGDRRRERDGDEDRDMNSAPSGERRSLMRGGSIRSARSVRSTRNARRRNEEDEGDDIEARGDAPAYFEVVEDDYLPPPALSHPQTTVPPTTGPTAPTAQTIDLNATVTRRSGFRTFLNRMSFGGSGSSGSSGLPLPVTSSGTTLTSSTMTQTTAGIAIQGTAQGTTGTQGSRQIDGLPHHHRTTSSLSVYPPGSGEGRASSPLSHISNGNTGTNTRHRANTSTSTNASRLSLFRPLSRQRSTNTLNFRSGTPSSFSHSASQLNLNNPSTHNLTSPSLHSLISPPLSHTLLRTEITYPPSGPTPEQVRALSSRESIARFGVPFGEEAVRWAGRSRSRVDLTAGGGSRVDLNEMPPGFDEAVGGGSGGGRGGREEREGRGHERGDSTGSLGVPVPSTLGVGISTPIGAYSSVDLTAPSNGPAPTTSNSNAPTTTAATMAIPHAITIEPPSRGVSRRNTVEVYERHEDEKERERAVEGVEEEVWEDEKEKEKKDGVKEEGEKEVKVEKESHIFHSEPEPESNPELDSERISEFGAVVRPSSIDLKSNSKPKAPPSSFPTHTFNYSYGYDAYTATSNRSESRASAYSTATMDTVESFETARSGGVGEFGLIGGRGESRAGRNVESRAGRNVESRAGSRAGGRMSEEWRNESRAGRNVESRAESRSTHYTDFEDFESDDEEGQGDRTARVDEDEDSDEESDGSEGEEGGTGVRRDRKRDTVIASSVNGSMGGRKRDTVIAPVGVSSAHNANHTTTEEDEEEPTTPTLGGGRYLHLAEGSDATVMQK